jgi:WD and tetratricopeptide repeat-containing protein 1
VGTWWCRVSPIHDSLEGQEELMYRVKVLKCHRDRTKKIATENSPFLFMTVAEDGTVRQHDLRRPHRCRSECPDPLFRAPQGVDLYSLSVSTPAPHIFAVAGRTDTVSPISYI